MNPAELARFITEHYRGPGDQLFRMETLPQYAVTSDGDDYYRWLAGATEPDWSRKQPWLDNLRRNRDNGQVSRRVRILSERVTDYERYSCDFGYRLNAQFEEIRVLHHGEHRFPNTFIEADFWVINDMAGVVMCYGDRGEFLSAEIVQPGELTDYRQMRDAAWALAEPFEQWWQRHPELHRKTAA